LPNIGLALAPLFLPSKSTSRADFGLLESATVYLCVQIPSKYLPRHDFVFPAIASSVPTARFVFLERRSAEETRVLRRRLEGAFAAVGLRSRDFVQFLPSQPYYRYLDLLRLGDVFLDTFEWSGGMTTLDAVGCGLPVVTCPGSMMRGRQSLGILTRLGVTETVASTLDEYTRIAIRLGQDGDWRRQVSDRLRRNLPDLYNDRMCVQALEAFYRRAVDGRAVVLSPPPTDTV
jgi:predicted O-linked N-acetylglucosamine transferase (SPINDLY family)